MNIKFSIIVPIYNVQNYLKQCIESILDQHYTDFELILVDDGSKDNSPLICDMYAEQDSRIYVIHKCNEGVVKARKTGIEHSKGQYLICLDSDDYLHPECLKILHRTIQASNAEVICFGAFRSYHDRILKVPISNKFKRQYYSKDDIEASIFPYLIQATDASYFPPQLWGKCFLRTLCKPELLAIDDSINLGEDGACTISILYRANSLQIIEDSLYYYRINPTSITNSCKVFSFKGPELIHLHLESRLDISRFDFQEQLYRKTAHELFSVIRSQFYRKDKYFNIRQDIIENCKNPIYDECIRKAKFSNNLKATIMSVALKYRLVELIYLSTKLY